MNRLATAAVGGHLVAAIVVCVVLAMALAISALFTDVDTQDRVTGSLTALGPVEVTLDAAPGNATSPVCGCFKIKHRKDWRGIAFAARRVEISRLGERAGTYVVTAANPDPATWEPGDLHFPAELLTFERTWEAGTSARFDPAALTAGASPSGWRLLQRHRLRPQEMILMTSVSPLNVNMLGPAPVGAWVPSRNGKVRLDFSQGLTADAPLRGELTEVDKHPKNLGALGHPMVDFLGPDVVIWTRDRTVTFETADRKLRVPHRRIQGETIHALLIRHPPFATRVAVMPIILPPRLLPQKSKEYSWLTSVSRKDTVSYRLQLAGRPLSSHDYMRIQSRFRGRNVVWMKHLTGWFPAPRKEGRPYVPLRCDGGRCWVWVRTTLQHDQKMKFRYPPKLPAEQGFTVFGPLRSLHLTEARGAVSSQPPMRVPTDLRLQDVNLLGPSIEGALPVPADETGYELNLSASSDGTAADQPLVNQESFREKLSFWLFIVTAIAAVAALYFAAVAYVNRTKR